MPDLCQEQHQIHQEYFAVDLGFEYHFVFEGG
jgi:hypothetical protein